MVLCSVNIVSFHIGRMLSFVPVILRCIRFDCNCCNVMCRNIICWGLTSWQHLTSYEDCCRRWSVHTHGYFIILSHWDTRSLAPLSHIILARSYSVLPYLIKGEYNLGIDKYQFDKLLVWLGCSSTWKACPLTD